MNPRPQDTIHAHEQSGQRFDCIILDCNMPVLSGIECARRLREEEKESGPNSKSYRIIGCTGQARPDQVSF
jgi:CheY-like chemotaxis protein